jgi:hypothetical protein
MTADTLRCGFFRAVRVPILGLVCALLFVLPGQGVPPKYFEVSKLRVSLDSGSIAVSLSISVDNVTGLYEMLKDGASVELAVSTKIERPRTFWTNVSLAETELLSTLQHNPLTREFALYMPGETKPLLDRNLDRLLDATWRKFTANLGPTDILDGEQGTDYRITLTLNLQHAKPPPWLAKDFVLWSKKITEQEVVVAEFTH